MFIANFFLHIRPNPYLVGVTGVLLAWLATWAVVVFRDRPKKLAEAEDKIRIYNVDMLPYVRPKYQSIVTKDETPRNYVVRLPHKIEDTQEWLAKYAPKQLDAEPVSNPAVDGRDENPSDS